MAHHRFGAAGRIAVDIIDRLLASSLDGAPRSEFCPIVGWPSLERMTLCSKTRSFWRH
jgi:hypothetical protein